MTSLHASQQDFDSVWIKAFRKRARRRRIVRVMVQATGAIVAIVVLGVSIGCWWTLSWVTR